MISTRVKRKIKATIVHRLLLTKEFLETKPRLKTAAAKLLGYLPYLGPRLQGFGKSGSYRHEVKNEKELSLSSRAVYHKLVDTIHEKRRGP